MKIIFVFSGSKYVVLKTLEKASQVYEQYGFFDMIFKGNKIHPFLINIDPQENYQNKSLPNIDPHKNSVGHYS